MPNDSQDFNSIKNKFETVHQLTSKQQEKIQPIYEEFIEQERKLSEQAKLILTYLKENKASIVAKAPKVDGLNKEKFFTYLESIYEELSHNLPADLTLDPAAPATLGNFINNNVFFKRTALMLQILIFYQPLAALLNQCAETAERKEAVNKLYDMVRYISSANALAKSMYDVYSKAQVETARIPSYIKEVKGVFAYLAETFNEELRQAEPGAKQVKSKDYFNRSPQPQPFKILNVPYTMAQIANKVEKLRSAPDLDLMPSVTRYPLTIFKKNNDKGTHVSQTALAFAAMKKVKNKDDKPADESAVKPSFLLTIKNYLRLG